MTDKERNRKYPLLSLRFKRVEMAYLRREASERNMKVTKYARRVLIPFEIPDGKK